MIKDITIKGHSHIKTLEDGTVITSSVEGGLTIESEFMEDLLLHDVEVLKLPDHIHQFYKNGKLIFTTLPNSALVDIVDGELLIHKHLHTFIDKGVVYGTGCDEGLTIKFKGDEDEE